MKWLIILFGIMTNASASLLIKTGLQTNRLSLLKAPFAFFQNWQFLLGIFLYGITFILYILSLKFLPLNVAHPSMTSGAIGMVALLSVITLGESLSLPMIIGLGFIVFGVILLTSFAK